MLKKGSENEIAGFQSFTIRNLENKLASESDIEPYKVLSVKEDPLDNQQQYLDVMCFPVLLQTGEFGEYHLGAKLSNSEYIKSRLLNKVSRFRKYPQYVHHSGRRKCKSYPQVCITCWYLPEGNTCWFIHC